MTPVEDTLARPFARPFARSLVRSFVRSAAELYIIYNRLLELRSTRHQFLRVHMMHDPWRKPQHIRVPPGRLISCFKVASSVNKQAHCRIELLESTMLQQIKAARE